MKKIIIMALLIICSTVTFTVFARNDKIFQTESIEFDEDKDEIYALKDKIVEEINNTIYSENKELLFSKNTREYITSEDIDFNDMYKEYSSPEIFSRNLIGKQTVDYLKNCDYHWIIPMHFDEITIEIVIQRGKPVNKERVYATDENGERLLSDERIAALEAKVGHWYISSTGIGPKNTRYEDAVNKAKITNSIDNTIYFISANIGNCAFIVTDDGNYINCFNKYIINQYNKDLPDDYVKQSEIVEISDKYSQDINNILNNNGKAGGVSGGSSVNNNIDKENNNSMFILMIIVIISIILASIILYFIVKHRKSLKTNKV